LVTKKVATQVNVFRDPRSVNRESRKTSDFDLSNHESRITNNTLSRTYNTFNTTNFNRQLTIIKNNIRQAGEMFTQKRWSYKRYSVLIQSVMIIFQIGCFSLLWAQTTDLPRLININSGDPKYPFPQFLPYKNPTTTYSNLSVRTGVGVSHAEMETTIRDAYQIMMNGSTYAGGSVGGKKYIKYLSNPQCSEGDGYGLLGAASMADKETFDGMWLYIHDFTLNKVKRYSDCKEASPGYLYSQLPGWTGAGANSATDGDVDIGFALLTAYLQWGEFMGINDACGEPISYKKEAINFLKGLTDTLVYGQNGLNYITGDIGLDGYIKSGDSWTETTDWASDKTRSGFSITPEGKGPQTTYVDYSSPSYFHAFADFLANEDSTKYAWNIKQFRRAEASCDWIIGQMLKNEKMIPFAGRVSISSDNVPTFTTFNSGEDFRYAWRTIMNSMWYGNPTSTWDPVSHQVKANVGNSYEQDIGKRYARFLWDSRQAPWLNAGITNAGGDKNTLYWGPETLKDLYSQTGQPLGTFPLNWVPGTGSPSAIISQDFNLIAELYRKLEMTWDSQNEERYLKSIPVYYHGWFRLLGLLVLSGNYQALSEIKPTANMKVYCAINKTFGFEGDSVVYTLDYRNYGSLDAQSVKIVDTLHKDFVYVGSTGGGTYNSASHTVTWNIGSVNGFKSSPEVLPTTKGQVTLTVKVGNATDKQYRNRATISCSNGSGWTSDEYPNKITAVMERNYLDIAKRALILDKKASNTMVNPGKELTFSIDFENTSEAGWINGGRSGVNFSYSRKASTGNDPTCNMRFKLFHDADEAYIDYGNYRVSYFLFDAGLQCYQNASSCPQGWSLNPTIVEGIEKSSVKVLHENIMAGSDANGKWNQRIIVQFSDPTDPKRVENLVTTNYHLDWYRGVTTMIHRGGTSPLRVVWDLYSSNYQAVDWTDDWSWDADAVDAEDGKYWPITNDWTDPDNPDVPVTTWNPKQCNDASHLVDNILVEEWDGYTWRRVAGNGPMPGREVTTVVIKDTIPDGLVFNRFTGEPPLGVSAKIDGKVITWTIPKMQIKQKGSLKYVVTAAGNCPMQNKTIVARSWLSADKESALSDSTTITITCDPVPPPPPEPTTLYKVSDKPVYRQGDTVTYKVNYKQTHGTIVTNATNADEWIDVGGKGKFTIKSDTILYDKKAGSMVHKYAFGKNGIFGGTVAIPTWDSTALLARVAGNEYLEIRLINQNKVIIKFFNNGKQVGADQPLMYKTYPDPFNFKVRLSEDTVQFWCSDTSALLPGATQTGLGIREGHAGVKDVAQYAQAKVWGWNSHMDAAFDVSIHDKLPSNLTYRSAGGSIITGANKGKTLTPNNVNGDIKWDVISGDTPLSANDSLSLWIKATLDNCSGDTIRNTAFTNIRGWPVDNIGAINKITCASGDIGKPDHIDIIVDTVTFNRSKDEYLDPITLGSNQATYVLYAVIRDKFGNFVSYADNAQWRSSNTSAMTIKGGNKLWIGTITNVGVGSSTITVTDNSISKSDTITVTVSAPIERFHIDIITDTINFNKTSDIYLNPVTLGSTPTTYVFYAIIRDKSGKFVSFADNAKWSSSNTSAVTIKGGDKKWIGTITNPGAGSSMIIVTDDSLSTSDTITVKVLTAAEWLHIDMIIDTASFNRTSDEYLDPITIGSNQNTFVLYAVIRDKLGNFVSYANQAQWSSSNTSVVTAQGGNKKWIGTITNTGAGSSLITVTDNSISKSDTITVTVLTSPAWPSIKSAIMRDSNGDLVPDQMDVVLTNDFETNQRLDSLAIEYKGRRYVVNSQTITKNGLNYSLSFTSNSGKDGTPDGNIIMYMTVDGNGKKNTKSFNDGVGPALTSASVIENNADVPDVLILSFSETIVPSTLYGKQLLLINGTDTAKLSIDKILSLESDSQVTVELAAFSKRPLAGDKLRLVPGTAGGTASDMNYNLPHLNNEPVIITLRKGPAGVASAIYLDANADGYIDSIRVKFKRAVTLDEFNLITAVLHLDKVENVVVDKNNITLISDSTVGFGINVKALSNNVKINTSMMIELSIVFTSKPTEPVLPKVSDRAAPVIVSAKILPGSNLDDGSGRLSDTLLAEMSEKLSEPLGTEPFNFVTGSNGSPYSLRLRLVGSDNRTYRFIVESTNGNMINSGDSIWINNTAKVSDLNGSIQENIKNRRDTLSIVWPAAQWKVAIGPNPFKPGETVVSDNIPERGKGFGAVIRIRPSLSVNIEKVDVRCRVYDLLGNMLFEKKCNRQGDSYYVVWDGSNQNNRFVGAGTYKVFAVIDGKAIKPAANLGVKR
jgi:uncharacterized repeat protein (TIGR01451 family)